MTRYEDSYSHRTDSLGAQQHFYQHSPNNHVTSRISVQRDNSFLRPALEARHIGNTRRKSTLPGPACLCDGSLTNPATVVIEDGNGGWHPGKCRGAPRHLYGTYQLLRVLRRSESHTIGCHIRDFPYPYVGVEFQTTECK